VDPLLDGDLVFAQAQGEVGHVVTSGSGVRRAGAPVSAVPDKLPNGNRRASRSATPPPTGHEDPSAGRHRPAAAGRFPA
jgi:hypothetical protein